MTRQLQCHLHSGNDAKHFYRKNQLFMERRANTRSDLTIEIQQMTKEM